MKQIQGSIHAVEAGGDTVAASFAGRGEDDFQGNVSFRCSGYLGPRRLVGRENAQ
jgi:hypothetical protein